MSALSIDTILLHFKDEHGKTPFTIRDAVEGVQIFGGIGSGKTSGSGETLAIKYLSHGFGGLVLTAKPDETAMWEKYCEYVGRKDDLIILRPGGDDQFNFLEYVSSQPDKSSSLTGNIVHILKTVIKASENQSSGRSDDTFWEKALDMLMSNTIDLCKLAYGKVSVQHMYDIATSAPKKEDKIGKSVVNGKENPFIKAFDIAKKKINAACDAWYAALPPRVKQKYDSNLSLRDKAFLEDVPDARLFSMIDTYYIDVYKNLNEKTRSIIDFSLGGFLYQFLQEPFYSLFANGDSTVVPEDCLQGKIIVLDLPVKLYHQVGRDCQIMFKYIWQLAMERRNTAENNRPVFLWADEAQNFLHEHDAEYQATARSSLIATVYLSQNLPNYLASMSAAKSVERVKSFLGTMATKIFHANADYDTNKYASDLIGEIYMEDLSKTKTIGASISMTENTSFKLDKMVRPEGFVHLSTGGPLNKLLVTAYIHHQGKKFHTGASHFLATFLQF